MHVGLTWERKSNAQLVTDFSVSNFLFALSEVGVLTTET